MADVKWIKLYTDMASNKKIKRIRKMPEGNNIILIWVFLLIQAGDCNKNGALYLTDTIPFKAEDLAIEFDFELGTINFALITLEKFGMIEIFEDIIFIKNWSEYQNIDGMDKIREQNRLRKQKEREAKKLLQSYAKSEVTGAIESNMSRDMSRDVTDEVTQCHAIEVEGEGDIEVDIDINTTPAANKKTDRDYIKFFNNNMGHLMTPYELELLQSYVEDGMELEVITMALEEAVEADARDIRYIKTILNRWLEHGLKSAEAVEADKRDFKNKQKKKDKQQSNYQHGKKNSTFNNFQQRDLDPNIEEQLLKKNLGEETEVDVNKMLKDIREN